MSILKDAKEEQKVTKNSSELDKISMILKVGCIARDERTPPFI
jgi:hypothetical protein